MKKIDKAEKDLWKVHEDTTTERELVRGLSLWIIKYFGNVNVAQRLNILSQGCD